MLFGPGLELVSHSADEIIGNGGIGSSNILVAGIHY